MMTRGSQDVKRLLLAVLVLTVPSPAGCAFVRGQRFHDFQTPTPLSPDHVLILGFMGGREPWDNPKRGVRKLALKLRASDLDHVRVETVENKKRELALRLIQRAFDRDRDGTLDDDERRQVRLILYGQSFGGAAVVKLARQLHDLDIPVLLTIQIDSVGHGDVVIPPNVARAANLHQRDGWVIRGEPRIIAEDPERTRIVGNYRFGYGDKKIDLSEVSWFKKLLRTAHTKMDFDPEVWHDVEALIRDSIARLETAS